MPNVKDVTLDLLRQLELTTIVGNPGSTEETFLKNFPKDFTYILALQEASVIGIADGLSQGLRKPVIVNIHTGAGLGNAMGCLLTAYQNKTPLIITAGQQTREMLLLEPLLTNIEAINMPKPWVKWSYEPPRPDDIPAAFMRAYAIAVQQPQGPVFLSLPLDDWDKEMKATNVYRTVAMRIGPDPEKVAEFAKRINESKKPLLIYGADIARSKAWDAGIELSEKLHCQVWTAPFTERTPFPESHTLYAGVLPPAIGPLSDKLKDHDLVLVIGAPVFRYYPFVAGSYLPSGMKLLHVTDDPDMSAKAAVGDSLVSDSLLFIKHLLPLVHKRPLVTFAKEKKADGVKQKTGAEKLPLFPAQVFEILAPLCPEDYLLVEESPSSALSILEHFKINKPDCFYTFVSGGLGWDMPAAVGLALAEKQSNRNRPVIAIIGDGSFQYSVQSIYTSVQQKAHVIFLVMRNKEYGILKEFAILENTPNVPGLDLPDLDILSLGKGYGAKTISARTKNEIIQAFNQALAFQGTTVIEIPVRRETLSLIT